MLTIDLSPTVQGHAGLGRYAGEVARAIAAHHSEMGLHLFYNYQTDEQQLPADLAHLPHTALKMSNKPWRMGVMLSNMLHVPMDRLFQPRRVFHAPNHLLAHFRHARTVYTLHDLIFLRYPEYHMAYNRWYLTLTMPRYLQAADIIITPSYCSMRDAMHYYQLPESKFRVIYEAPAPTFQPIHEADRLRAIRQQYDLPERYILHVGTIEPRKNLSRLLEAFQPLLTTWPDLRLLLIGKKGWLYDEFFHTLQQLGLTEHVIFPGYVAEADLAALYQMATMFVYPSLYEGFGLPPLEAMACGTPVISSNAASLPEVVGEAGLLVEPLDTGALHQAMHRLLTDEPLRVALARRGEQRAAQFTWRKAAAEHVAVYQTLAYST